MDPLTLGVVVVGASLLLARRNSTAQPKQEAAPQSTPPPEPKKEDPVSNLIDAVKDFGKDVAPFIPPAATTAGAAGGAAGTAGLGAGAATAATVGVGLALSAASAVVNAKLTGDIGGGIVGGLNYTLGTGFNLGRVGGKEIDRALGGSGQFLDFGPGQIVPDSGVGTGTIGQLGGGATVVTAAIFGAAAILGALSFWVPAYILGAIISDANRLSYGQAGARRDYNKKWGQAQSTIFDKLQEEGVADGEAYRIAATYADGYMRHVNKLAFMQWMKRGRGLLGLGGVSELFHARYGRDRGYFVGDVDSSANLTNEPELFSNSEEFYRRVWNVSKAEVLSYPGQKPLLLAGEYAANTAAYYAWMAEPRGLLVDDNGHFNVGIKEGRFVGGRDETYAPGSLRWFRVVDISGDKARAQTVVFSPNQDASRPMFVSEYTI